MITNSDGSTNKKFPICNNDITLLPHSGVSLVFTGIAVNTLSSFDASLSDIVSGTIVAAAIINEIIAVILAKLAFKWAGEISK